MCRYAPYEGAQDTGVRVELFGHAMVGYFHQQIKGVDFVFVDHPSYPRPGGLYSDQHGVYGDNQVRYGTAAVAVGGCRGGWAGGRWCQLWGVGSAVSDVWAQSSRGTAKVVIRVVPRVEWPSNWTCGKRTNGIAPQTPGGSFPTRLYTV